MILYICGMMVMSMNESADKLVTYICDYATSLLECGATTARIERNVCRMSEAYGYMADVSIYPRHVEVVMTDGKNGTTFIHSKVISDSIINYSTVSALSKLSWNCLDRRLPLSVAMRQYRRIVSASRISPMMVTVLTSLANASFCRLFEGDFLSMAIVFFATFCGFYIKGALCRKWNVDIRLSIIVAGCMSAVLSCSGYVFGWGGTPDVALATSVLYLVPGIPYLNAVSDLINGHYICAMSRFIHAAVITACLSVGLYIGLLLMDVGLV